MNTKRGPLEEQLFGAGASDDVGSCPDPSVLARAADGCLDAEERPALEAHLLVCDGCSGIVATLGQANVTRSPRGARRFLRPALVAAAAVVLVALLFRVLIPEAPMAERLVASCRSFAFDAMTEPELAAGGTATLRGGVKPILPRGRVLSVRPAFRWEQPDEEPVDFLLVAVDRGEILWQLTVDARVARSGRAMPYPPEQPALPAGETVVWKVGPKGAADAAEGVMLTVASADERAAAEKTLEEIDRRADEKLRDLVAAHFALRRGYLAEAERRAFAFYRSNPSEPLARATLNHVERRLGLPETAEAKGE